MDNKRLLIIGHVWPEPQSSAAGSRTLQLISFFQKNSWHITFVTPAAESENAVDLSKLSVTYQRVKINDSSFNQLLLQLNPQCVLFDRYLTEEQFGWRVEEVCPEAIRILDTIDLQCLRNARHDALKTGEKVEELLLQSEITKREIASVYRCDLSLIISSYEMELLEDTFQIDNSLLMYLPFMMEEITEKDKEGWKGYNEREHFVTIGNFMHAPNWDAVLLLKERVWPIIRDTLPAAQLHIYGAYPTQKVFDLNQPKDGFIVKGRADDVNEVMSNARVCIAPLRFGAGLKGKLVDAISNGTPSVTTSIGVEGMQGDNEWPGAVEASIENIAQQSVKLYYSKEAWEEAQSRCSTIVNSEFNKEHHEERFLMQMNMLIRNLNSHRSNNFIGAMLKHHHHKSTKYMSRWIEEKNKIKQ